MISRPRVFAIASVAALAAALATGVSQPAAGASTPVAFTFQSTSASFTNGVVSAGARGAAVASASIEETDLAPRWAKGNGPGSLVNANGGVPAGSSATSSATTSAPTQTASFIGQQSSATTCSYFGHGCNPPDMAIAASPNFVLQGVNTQFEVLDTKGNIQPGWPVSAQKFFGAPDETALDSTGHPCDAAHGNQPFLSDPRALYDPVDGRFWAAMLQVEGSVAFGVAQSCPYKSAYWVAVSATSDPTGSWNVYEFNMETDVNNPDGTVQKFAADYTQLGINSKAVFFSGNMFGEQGGFFAELFEANKAQMESGGTAFTADGFFNLQGTGPGTGATGPFFADTVNPALNFDGGSSETFVDTMDGPDVNTGHLCGFTGERFADSCSGLVVWTMTNPTGHDTGGKAPGFSGTLVPTAPFLVNVPADQPSCNNCIDANDLRIPATPVVRNGVLYAAWGTSIDAGNSRPRPDQGIEWAQVKLSDDTATTGYFSSTDEALIYPAVMPDAHGNVTMLYEHMSHKVFPETRFIVKGAGDANFSGAGQLLKAGESSYRPTLCGGKLIPVCRWGDFEATSWDGDGHIWFAGQYANQFQGVATPPVFGRNWGTWIGAIAAS